MQTEGGHSGTKDNPKPDTHGGSYFSSYFLFLILVYSWVVLGIQLCFRYKNKKQSGGGMESGILPDPLPAH